MTDTFTVQIHKLDEVNRNGRIYTTREVQKALDKNEGRDLVGSIGYPKTPADLRSYTEFPLDMISHVAKNVRIEDGWLVGDIKVLDTPHGTILTEMITSGMTPTFRPMGYAAVNEDNEVIDLTLTAICVVPGDSAA